MRFLTPAMLTVVLLLVVGGLVVGYVAKNMLATEAPKAERRNYPMAIADLKPGTVIGEQHLAMGPWPVDMQKPTYALSNTVLLGRVVKKGLTAAQPIDTLDLYPPGEYPPLEITRGMRAVTVELGDATAVLDGLSQPGEFVDVHFTPGDMNDDRFRGGFTMTMFKGVKVLAVNRARTTATAVGRNSSSVTLELTPEQSNILLLAQQKGQLNIIYTPDGRGNGGVAVADKDKAYFEEILGLAPRVDEQPIMTEVYYGGGRSVTTFGKDGRVLSGGGGWSGNDAGVNGMGNRPAPFQSGGHEPTGGWGNGYYQGAGNSQSATPPGAAGVNGNSASRGGWGQGGFQNAETQRNFGS